METDDIVDFSSFKHGVSIMAKYGVVNISLTIVERRRPECRLLAKPIVVKKFKSFHDYVKKNDNRIGQKQRGIDVNLNNACNLRCEHCFTNSPLGEGVKHRYRLKLERIADEARPRYLRVGLTRRRILLQPEYLFDSLKAIKTERFYMYLTTNGWHLDSEMAERLAAAGIDVSP